MPTTIVPDHLRPLEWGRDAVDLIRAEEAADRRGVHTPAVGTTFRRFAAAIGVLAGSWVLGAVLCIMKGEGGGLPMVLGNLVAPYFVVAVAAGLASRRGWLSALLGVAATELTVHGFYWTWAHYFNHEVSHSAVVLWSSAGLFSGLVFGVVGHAARSRPALRYTFPVLLFLEPGAMQLVSVFTSRFGIGYAPSFDPIELVGYAIEVAVGVVVLLAVRQHVRGQRRRTAASSASPETARVLLPRTTA